MRSDNTYFAFGGEFRRRAPSDDTTLSFQPLGILAWPHKRRNGEPAHPLPAKSTDEISTDHSKSLGEGLPGKVSSPRYWLSAKQVP